MKDPAAEDGKRRVKAKTEFFKADITPNEMGRLKSGEPTHGSLSYSCRMDFTAGEHNGVQYDAIERGPYVFHEYSLVRSGIVFQSLSGFLGPCNGTPGFVIFRYKAF